MKRQLGIIILLLACGLLQLNAKVQLLPKPQRINVSKGSFSIDKIRVISPVLTGEINSLIVRSGGNVTNLADRSIEVEMLNSSTGLPTKSEEYYKIGLTSKKVLIQARSTQAVYWALQTLEQLRFTRKGKSYFPTCEVIDWPAFPVRGFLHDTGRSFISMDELKKEIALLSHFKVNVFHWHLTENQAWRLESKIFPELNDSVNTTRFPGKFYTIDEAKELVEFCKSHQVMLIPEIDMPGHSAVFERAFHCSMQSTAGKLILKKILDEVCAVFDVPYIHIGTDEVVINDSTFVPEMVSYIRNKGKKVISWNPGWHYKPGEIDMTQLWSYRGKAQPGIPAIDSKFHYINHFDVFGDIVALYNSRIGNVDYSNNDIAGSILAVWNDRILSTEKDIIQQNSFYPAMLALAERAWLGGGTEYFDVDGVILKPEKDSIFSQFVDFENRMLFFKSKKFSGCPFPYVKQTNVKWNITDAFPNNGKPETIFPPEKELASEYVFDGKKYSVSKATGAGIYLRHTWGKTVPAFFKNPVENSTAYAYTWVYSPKKQSVGLLAEFQNYGRSEMDLAPPMGEWDYNKSRIFINDAAIQPPVWTATHTVKSNEIPLGNENMTARPPIRITLNKGWNKVLIKLPVGKFTMPEVRLVKWMFSFVFVTFDAQQAVDGLIYSPERLK